MSLLLPLPQSLCLIYKGGMHKPIKGLVCGLLFGAAGSLEGQSFEEIKESLELLQKLQKEGLISEQTCFEASANSRIDRAGTEAKSR
ncbi:MAG TPA: hypothetical protein VD994_17170 [Prosthecobacter sp.]|nr:hypothetical protein [Prosthecobacter sp.]